MQAIYYGLEDGLVLGYVHSKKADFFQLDYRESSKSGYSLNNSNKEKTICFNTYINSKIGEERNCTTNVGDKYILYINNCALIQYVGL